MRFVTLLVVLAGCGGDSAVTSDGWPAEAAMDASADAPASDANYLPDSGWTVGNTFVVTDTIPSGGITSMAADPNFFYFNIYSGPLEKVAHIDTNITMALPRDSAGNDRYEMHLDGDAVYWSNGLGGGGNPGEIHKTSLSQQRDVWRATGLNGPNHLAFGAGYIFSIDWGSVEVNSIIERVSPDGTMVVTVYDPGNNDPIMALTADPSSGDIFFTTFRRQTTLSVLRFGQTAPSTLMTFSSNIDTLTFFANQVYVGARPSIYRVNASDGTMMLVVADTLNSITTLLIDNDGIYWNAGGAGINAAFPDGSHIIMIAPGPRFFVKQGIYCYFGSGTIIYRRTLARQ